VREGHSSAWVVEEGCVLLPDLVLLVDEALFHLLVRRAAAGRMGDYRERAAEAGWGGGMRLYLQFLQYSFSHPLNSISNLYIQLPTILYYSI
jgi:hypothetical protein